MEILCRQGGQMNIMFGRKTKYVPVVAAAAIGMCYWQERKPLCTHAKLYAQETVDGDSWYSKLISKSGPQKPSSLSDEYMSTLMKKQEYCYKIHNGSGPISWFETNHYNANNPIEDRHCECYFNVDDSYMFGIFDGHSGWHCSESLRLRLPLYVSLSMTSTDNRKRYLSKGFPGDLVKYLGNPDDDCLSFKMPDTFQEKQERIQSGTKYFAEKSDDVIPSMNVEDTLKYAYLSLDRDITRESIPDGLCNEAIWTGLSGAVAISAYIKDNQLHVANTGDCRAVVGTKTDKGDWVASAMSVDHNDDNIDEVKRLSSDHPGEKAVIFRGRLLGQLQPLRAFGDIVYKWSIELHRKVLDVLYGRPLVPESIYLTPPYLTAQPDVISRELTVNDGFLILATDGLWDTVSNEMAVKIVGEYLEELKAGKKLSENSSTKLIRFALGGGSNSRLSEIIQIPENQKRNFHDDITVTVVFFRNNETLQSKL